MEILRTERLLLREFTPHDADFIVALLNEPDWKQHINDAGVRTREAALLWMQSRLFKPYREQGHGFWAVQGLPSSQGVAGELLGLCGLHRRPSLPGPDLGYALLARHTGQGYALEAAQACVHHARQALGWPELLAITALGNLRSEHLLSKLGFAQEGVRQLDGIGGLSRIWRRTGDSAAP
jgi:[ribosomal protein S5]-alanine N-acetyltransferase